MRPAYDYSLSPQTTAPLSTHLSLASTITENVCFKSRMKSSHAHMFYPTSIFSIDKKKIGTFGNTELLNCCMINGNQSNIKILDSFSTHRFINLSLNRVTPLRQNPSSNTSQPTCYFPSYHILEQGSSSCVPLLSFSPPY